MDHQQANKPHAPKRGRPSHNTRTHTNALPQKIIKLTHVSCTEHAESSALDSDEVHILPIPSAGSSTVADLSDHVDRLQAEYDNELGTGDVGLGGKRKRYQASNDPLIAWLPYKGEFLDEFLRQEGSSAHGDGTCHGCGGVEDPPLFLCEECHIDSFVCYHCSLARHRGLPLHRVKKWNGLFFEPTSLNIALHLGHAGEACLNAVRANKDFCIIHTNGIHQVNASFCGCPGAPLPRLQLLRAGYFPATVHSPQTCATFQFMRFAHILLLQSKVSVYDLYATIERISDNTGVRKSPARYRNLLLMILIWRILKMMKRAGRGHDPRGFEGIQAGDLAILCPCCPQPGINLPNDWQSSRTPFLYMLILAMDANFRLKCRAAKNLPGVITGKAYFVPQAEYDNHLAKFGHQDEKLTCTGLSAINQVNTRNSKGLSTTGVGAVMCKHELYRPNGVGDLQKGEKFANMDFILFSSLTSCRVKRLLISYDISCQYSCNIWSKRHPQLPPALQLNLDKVAVEFAIPKWHLRAHLPKCHTPFGLNYRPGVGQADCEGIERGWSKVNESANSTKEMTSGGRHDTLDDTFGDLNHEKIKSMGRLLLKQYVLALKMSALQSGLFATLNNTIPIEDQRKWEGEVIEWEEDNTKPDPYSTVTLFKTLAEVRRELIAEERAASSVAASSANVLSNLDAAPDMSMAGFVMVGIDIEDAQYELKAKVDTLKSSSTSNQRAKIEEQQLTLGRRIIALRGLQAVFMFLVPFEADEIYAHPETVELILPSGAQVPRPHPANFALIRAVESQLRYAQCTDTLNALRHSLCSKANAFMFKNTQCHQRAVTRARAVVDKVAARTVVLADRYRRARNAYRALNGPGEWESVLQELDPSDVRPINAPKDSNDGEGYRTLSWIWCTSHNQTETSYAIQNALRVEWACCRARKLRWQEQVEIVKEEMRRFCVTAAHNADVWLHQLSLRTDIPPELRQGLVAYAQRQRSILLARAEANARTWSKIVNICPPQNGPLQVLPSVPSRLTAPSSTPPSSPCSTPVEQLDLSDNDSTSDDTDSDYDSEPDN